MIKRIVSFIFLVVVAGCKTEDSITTSSLKPVISGMTPAVAVPGQQHVAGKIHGANFGGVVVVDLGPGITVENSSVASTSEINVTFSVTANATAGPVTVRIATAAGIALNSDVLSIGSNQLPIAKFTFDPANPGKNATVNFDASGSKDKDGSIARFVWAFGDGASGEGKTISHQYTSPGSFNVVLKVIDNQSAEATASGRIDVNDFIPPVAHYNVSPKSGTSLTVFTFDGSSSTDDDGNIVRYLWDLGNGVEIEGKKITHQFSKSNNYKVKLTVWDNQDQHDYVEKFLDVDGVPPVAQFTISPTAPSPGTPVLFSATESTDPDGRIRRFMWNFGNGAKMVGNPVTYTYPSPGDYEVTLTVIDGDDLRASTSKSLSVGIPPGDDDDDDDDDDDVPGGSCQVNGWFDNPFKAVAVSGFRITADRSFVTCSRLYGEIRRKAVGIREFIGDLERISGKDLTFNPHTLPTSTRPVVGETLYLVWRPCGG